MKDYLASPWGRAEGEIRLHCCYIATFGGPERRDGSWTFSVASRPKPRHGKSRSSWLRMKVILIDLGLGIKCSTREDPEATHLTLETRDRKGKADGLRVKAPTRRSHTLEP